MKPREHSTRYCAFSIHVISPGKTFRDTESPEGKNFQGVGEALPAPLQRIRDPHSLDDSEAQRMEKTTKGDPEPRVDRRAFQ